MRLSNVPKKFIHEDTPQVYYCKYSSEFAMGCFQCENSNVHGKIIQVRGNKLKLCGYNSLDTYCEEYDPE